MITQIIDFIIGALFGFLCGIYGAVRAKKDILEEMYQAGKREGLEERNGRL